MLKSQAWSSERPVAIIRLKPPPLQVWLRGYGVGQDSGNSLGWNQMYASTILLVAYILEYRSRSHLRTFELDGVCLKL